MYSLQSNICLKATNNNINDTKQKKYIVDTNRHLIKHLCEHNKVIKRNKFNGSILAAQYTGVYSNVKIEDRVLSVNLLHKFTCFIDKKF